MQRPSDRLFLSEPARAAAEAAAFAAAFPLLALRLPRGDGHPVLVLPGFLADDLSTVPLRRLLRRVGYHVHGWRLGTNRGPSGDLVDGLGRLLAGVHERHGRPVSLVGWSLGGIYAREMARRAPESVRLVVTLGSPFGLRDPAMSNTTRLVPSPVGRRPALPPEEHRPPLPVPVTAIYTRADGIVPWQSCVERPGLRRESVAVRGSHCGLGANVGVARVVADRLAQPEGTWEPFRRH